MNNWWRSYRHKLMPKLKNPSIAKEEVALLEEDLEFFTPRYSRNLSFFEVAIYVMAWSVFVTGFKIENLTSWQDFVTFFLMQAAIISLTLVPSIYLIALQREHLKSISIFNACLLIFGTTVPIGIIAYLVVSFLASLLGLSDFNTKSIIIQTALHALNILVLSTIILNNLIRHYKKLRVLKALFERKLDIQNDHIKARLAPHFFFNTINTLASLVETNSEQASELIQHVAHLFRSSFSEPKESSLEEEIELCKHYLAIEYYRLQDKLEVFWNLPDEDLMYDMSITSLTLQNVLEQTVLHVVEMTTETVQVSIDVSWETHTVVIDVSAQLPVRTLFRSRDINNISFRVQEKRLREHFGDTAKIYTKVSQNKVVNTISYPLHDALG